jgi:hypothetical protein
MTMLPCVRIHTGTHDSSGGSICWEGLHKAGNQTGNLGGSQPQIPPTAGSGEVLRILGKRIFQS